MSDKKVILVVTAGIILLSAGVFLTGCSFKNKAVIPEESLKKQELAGNKSAKVQTSSVDSNKKIDLYSNASYDLPLESVLEISKLPPELKVRVDEILEKSNGCYFIKYNKEHGFVKMLLQNPITENDTYQRHNLEFVTIKKDGQTEFKQEGYSGEVGEVLDTDNSSDVWEFDESVEPKRPLKHIVFDKKNKIKFTEIWNYDEKAPIKYEMRDGKDKPVSVLKETFDNESNYRQEHVFYSENGDTKSSVTINYDGANISRFTYFNSDEKDGISIISEYKDGVKVKEQIYNKDYELLNTVDAEYTDGERSKIECEMPEE